MASVYILYSQTLNRYYTGSCLDLEDRFKDHINKSDATSFTAKADDWTLFHRIDNLEYKQAREIEAHIKRMRSKKYIENLKTYPELNSKLIDRFRH